MKVLKKLSKNELCHLFISSFELERWALETTHDPPLPLYTFGIAVLVLFKKIRFFFLKYLSVVDEPDFYNALKPIQSPNLIGGEDLSTLTNHGPTFLNEPISQPIMNRPNFVEKPIPTLRPQAPHVRIDTCIVGDDSTCEIGKTMFLFLYAPCSWRIYT